MNQVLEYRKSIVEAKRLWDEIEDKANKKIFDDDEHIISRKVFDRQSELSIYGGGIALLSKAKGKPFLLYSPDVQKYFGINDINDYEYLKTPYNLNWLEKDLNYFIDLLFFISRETPCPEYVKNLKVGKEDKKPNYFEYPFQFYLRKEYEILHCSAGEILFFSLLWRILMDTLIKSKKLETIYNKDLLNHDNSTTDWTEIFNSTNDDFVEKILIEKIRDAIRKKTDITNALNESINQSVITANQLIQKIILNAKKLEDIYIQLNVFETKALTELNCYVQYIFNKSVPVLTLDNIPEFTDHCIKAFTNKVSPIDGKITINKLLIEIHKNARFPILPYYFLLQFDKEKKLKEHVVFPLWYTFSPDTQYRYTGEQGIQFESAILHALYTVDPIWETKQEFCSQWYTKNISVYSEELNEGFEKYLTELFSLFSAMSKPIIDKEYYAKQRVNDIESIKKQAIRAAISQVMARNSSHNIGSHVLNKLVRGLIQKDFNKKNYQESLFDFKAHHEKEKDCFDASNKPFSKCNELTLAQIEYFNVYIKNRMEYLGDMAMNTPMMSSGKYLVDDIFRDFDKVRLLLDNISGLDEKFTFKFRFIINKVEITKENLGDNDIRLAIANDVTGCQAMYNILENIIRNTAKHSAAGDNKTPIIFTIEVKNPESEIGDEASEYWQINVYDDIEKEDIGAMVASQNEILNKNVVIESTNKLRQGSLGMIEMDASAAYLRMMDLGEINKDENEILSLEGNLYTTKSGRLPILNANKFKKDKNPEPKCLGYQFYIAKPKEVLFVLDTDEFKINEDKNKGIEVLKKDDFIRNLNNGKAFTHQFVIANFEFDDTIKKHKAQYSNRVLNLSVEEIEKLVKDDFVKNIWTSWVSEYLLKGNLNKYYKVYEDIQTEDCPQLCFNDHEFTKEKVISKLEKIGDENSKYLSFEVLSSVAQSKLPNFNKCGLEELSKDKLQKYISQLDSSIVERHMLGEAAQHKILVIDERIQQFSRECYKYQNESVSYYALYQAMNVFMPSIKINDSEEIVEKENEAIAKAIFPTFEYDLSGKKLEESLIEEIGKLLSKIQPKYLLIHYGILERVFDKKKEDKIFIQLVEWANEFPNLDIIITSGRTRLEGLPTNVRFLNLAPLLTAVIDIRSKYVINKILNDSRI